MTMQLFLEPVDVWLFRDGKPFDALSDHRARSLFPPYPTVIQGAIRSHHLVVQKIDLRNSTAIRETVGTAEAFGPLRLRGPFIAKKENGKIIRYFPVPADVVPDKKAGSYRLLKPRSRQDIRRRLPNPVPSRRRSLLKPRSRQDIRQGMPYVLTNAPDDLPMLFWLPEGSEPGKEGFGDWLAEADLLRCLAGERFTVLRSEELFVRESRFGIGRDDATRTTREGALYEVEFIRPRPGVGLWVQVDGYDGWPAYGVMRIGGEGRGAYFEQIKPSLQWPQPPDPLPSRFKVYFASPTYFADGWRPKDGWSRFFDGHVQLQAVALNRYESIGGFDWASGDQKAARRYVPAGSVYYFTANNNACLKPKLTRNAITDYGAEIGFGQVIISEWKE